MLRFLFNVELYFNFSCWWKRLLVETVVGLRYHIFGSEFGSNIEYDRGPPRVKNAFIIFKLNVPFWSRFLSEMLFWLHELFHDIILWKPLKWQQLHVIVNGKTLCTCSHKHNTDVVEWFPTQMQLHSLYCMYTMH